MKFNEFKNPQLTEEQIVLSYCKGEITKEDAVSHLSEMKANLSEFDWRKEAEKRGLTGKFGFDTRAEQDAQDAEDSASLRITANNANAATPKLKNPVTKDPNRTIGDLRVTGPVFVNKAKTAKAPPAAKTKPPVAPTAANTRDYDKTMALQKKLIAQGANIQADGLMGPNTRAAMKAAGMGAKKPVAKKKLSGPERLSRLADIPAVSRALGARGELSKDDGEFADPNAMTRRKPKVAPKKKPRTLGKQNSKMPKSFGGFGPRVDDPKGGETVNLPFGMSYKTLPEKDRDSAFGDN